MSYRQLVNFCQMLTVLLFIFFFISMLYIVTENYILSKYIN